MVDQAGASQGTGLAADALIHTRGGKLFHRSIYVVGRLRYRPTALIIIHKNSSKKSQSI